MTLIVVVASQVCAHVQTPQIIYNKYVQIFVYQFYLTICLKKNMQRPHPVTHKTHKPHTNTHTYRNSTTQRITCGQIQHTDNIKRRNLHTTTQEHTCVLQIFSLHGLLLALKNWTFQKVEILYRCVVQYSSTSLLWPLET